MHADPTKVRQSLFNLLSNACKFTEGGTVRLEVERDGSWFNFRVIDTGIGITPEHLSNLFKPFSQVDSSLARQFEGTGLGLAMVKLLADLHGGAVAVESAVGEGSRFTVWIPMRTEEDLTLESTSISTTATYEVPAGARTALRLFRIAWSPLEPCAQIRQAPACIATICLRILDIETGWNGESGRGGKSHWPSQSSRCYMPRLRSRSAQLTP